MIEILEQLKRHKDADLEETKLYFEGMFKRGYPVFLLENIAKDAEAIGFKEGVHFIRQQKLPTE